MSSNKVWRQRCLCQTTFLLMLFAGLTVLAATGSPESANSSMFIHGVPSERHCIRLCWYHRLCMTYSFNTWAATPYADNCILHNSQIQESLATDWSTDGWVTKNVDSTSITNGCAPRPCGQTEFCAPTLKGTATRTFSCLHKPAYCGDTETPANATVSYVSKWQDATANMTCDSKFVIVPRHVSPNVTCMVTSLWEEFEGTCMQAVYSGPVFPEQMAMPWNVTDADWGACIRGVFVGQLSLVINFLRSKSTEDVGLHVALRYNFADYSNKHVITNFKYGTGAWGTAVVHEAMPLLPNDSFDLSFSVLSNLMLMKLFTARVGTILYQLPIIDAAASRYLNIPSPALRIRLSYMNLVSNCSSVP